VINEINSQKYSHNVNRNISGSKADAKSVKADAPSPAVTRFSSNAKSAASLAASAGLPADRLSYSIVSFVRFFSLPLKPEMLAAIRRQALTPNMPSSHNASNSASSISASALLNKSAVQNNAGAQDASSVLKTREALSLAASAAESKGVELTQKGLETYTEAVDPDWQRHDGGNQHDKREQKNSGEEKKEDNKQKENIINADAIKKLVYEFANNNKLTEMLNRLPSKSGKRWVVLPFEFTDNGSQFKVSMRILLENENRICNMALQINQTFDVDNKDQISDNSGQSSNKKWLFGFEFAGNKLVKVNVFLQNEMNENEQNKFKKELSISMEIPLENIFIKYSTENFPCEADCDDQFLSVNEVV